MPSNHKFNERSAFEAIEENRLDDAVEIFLAIIRDEPCNAIAFNNLGNLYDSLGLVEMAEESYLRAIEINSKYVNAHLNYASFLQAKNRFEDVLSLFEELEIFNDDTKVKALLIKAHANLQLGKFDPAIDCYSTLLSIEPENFQALGNCGVALYYLGRLEDAIDCFRRSLNIHPIDSTVLFNLGRALEDMLKPDEALLSYDKAISINPGYAQAYLNKSFALLLKGDFENGLPLYEWRHKAERIKKPIWSGLESINGKIILLYCEQGFGDTIQFCRYAKLLENLGATVFLEVQPALVSLLTDLDGISKIIAQGDDLPAYDYECPLLSLPLALQTTLETIPAQEKYICPNPAKVEAFGLRLKAITKPRVGLVWSGSLTHAGDSLRSIKLANLVRHLPNGLEYINLQKEIREDDCEILNAGSNILDLKADIVDFSDTAALIDNLDLVISADTSVAHLAAALGKPTWILLPYSPDWRWLLDREDSPWYPTAKLYRQKTLGDWDEVLERVKIDLQKKVDEHFTAAQQAIC
jgi:tetratricopeptide (TPR) repeat protein